MVTLMMVVMRTIVLARPVMIRCLLDVLTPLSLVTKRGSSFEMRVVILIGRGLVLEIFLGGVFLYLFFSFSFRYIIYILMYVILPISPCVVSFLSLYTCFLFIVCNILFLFHT